MVCHAAGEGLTHWRQRITYQTGCEECCSSVPLVTTVRAHLPASLPFRHHVLKTTVGRVLQLPLPVAWSYMAVNHFAHEACDACLTYEWPRGIRMDWHQNESQMAMPVQGC